MPYLMADQEKEFQTRRDANEGAKGEGYHERPSFPFQRRQPISDANLTEQVGQCMGDVGMHEPRGNDEMRVRMR
jgi:hypothetical protein